MVTALFRTQTKTPPSSRKIIGTPRPTAIMLKTSGEMESTGGEPEPTNTVLQETHEEELIYGLISDQITVQIKRTS